MKQEVSGGLGRVKESLPMDRVGELLEEVKRQGLVRGNFLGLLNVLIGRHIEKADQTPVSDGLTWRQLAGILKKHSWDRELVRELGLEPSQLPPRDREQFWYAAINRAQVDSPEAFRAGDRLATALKKIGYAVGQAPGNSGSR